jgi:hypothetical protein
MKDEALKLALEAFSVIAVADNLDWIQHQAEQQITAIKQALAAPVPCCGKYETCTQACTPRGKFLGAREANAELDATNRQVEILTDALAESRRDIDAMIALARADEREACAKVCDAFQARGVGMQPAECAGAIRAKGENT